MAVKRIDMRTHKDEIIKPLLDAGITLMPNTSGAKNAKEAIFAANLAREALGTDWVKVQISLMLSIYFQMQLRLIKLVRN